MGERFWLNRSMCCEFAPQSLHDRAFFVSSINASVMFVLACFCFLLCPNFKNGNFSSDLHGFTVFYSCLNGFFSSLPLAFCLLVSDHSNLPEIVSKVLTQEMQKIFVNKNLESFNEEFLKHNATSIQHQLSGLYNFLMLLQRRWFKWFKSRIFICSS